MTFLAEVKHLSEHGVDESRAISVSEELEIEKQQRSLADRYINGGCHNTSFSRRAKS